MEKFIVLPLDPTLLQCFQFRKNAITDPQVFAVFLLPFIDIFGKHPKIRQDQKDKSQRPQQGLKYAAEKDACDQQSCRRSEQKSIELIIAVSSGHKAHKAFSHKNHLREINSIAYNLPREWG